MSEKVRYSYRDYDSIKRQLLENAKKYYSDRVEDFSKSGMAEALMSMMSYIGDMASFNADYNLNETFLDSAQEIDSIIRKGREYGYNHDLNGTSYGSISAYVSVPTISNTTVNSNYIPRLKKGSIFSSDSGQRYTLVDDIDFSVNSITTVHKTSPTTNAVTHLAYENVGRIISGEYNKTTLAIGSYTRLLKIEIPIQNIAEIVSVVDSNGREYYEVESLSQDIVYKEITNQDANSSRYASRILKPFPCPRRYVLIRESDRVYLQFGYGSENDNLDTANPLDVSEVVFKRSSKLYHTTTGFDPAKLLSSSAMGIVPSDTLLTITYRLSVPQNGGAGIGSITKIESALWDFPDYSAIDSNTVFSIQNSLQVYNKEKLTGGFLSTDDIVAEEIRNRAKFSLSTQKRAVTMQDYKTLCYMMPKSLGDISRVSIEKKYEKNKKYLNLYVISRDYSGSLITTNRTIKDNLKTWISKYKMISDHINIVDANIINYSIEFDIWKDNGYTNDDVYNECRLALAQKVSAKKEIGEPIEVAEYYSVLKEIPGVIDVIKIKIFIKNGGDYATSGFSLSANTTPDGRLVLCPKGSIFEVKYPALDITGTVR